MAGMASLHLRSQWTLKTMNISLQTYGEKKGKCARTPQEGTSPTACCVLEEVVSANILKFIV